MSKDIKRLYLRHDVDAYDDIKIIVMRKKYGFAGYGLYWNLIERMWTEETLSMEYRDITFEAIQALAGDEIDVKQFINDCIDWELFVLEDGFFFSQSLIRRFETLDKEAKKKSETARQNVSKRWARHRKQGKEKEALKSKASESADDTKPIPSYTAVYDGIPTDTNAYEAIPSDTKKKRKEKIIYNNNDRARAPANIIRDTESSFGRLSDYYQHNISAVMSRKEHDMLSGWHADGFETDMLIAVIDAAVENNVKKINYISKIVEDCRTDGVTTLSQWQAKQAEFERIKETRSGGKGNQKVKPIADAYNSDTAIDTWFEVAEHV